MFVETCAKPAMERADVSLQLSDERERKRYFDYVIRVDRLITW